jgi:hypothetical protein
VSGAKLEHTERRDDLAAYALGALDGPDAEDVERHVASCATCAEYLRWLQPAVDLLPASVEQVRPPERLKQELMTAVRAEAEADREAAKSQRQRAPRGSGLGALLVRPATGLAFMAVLIAGAVAGYVLSVSSDSDRTVVEAEAVGTVPASAIAATLEHGGGTDAILHVERAPAPAQGDVYQAWVDRAGGLEPVASFRPARDGTADAALGDSLDGADAVLVTEEPTRDQQSPTVEPILQVDLD